MRTLDLRRLQMFVRVREFGTARREMFPVASSAGKLFAAVAAAAAGLEQALPRRLSTIATLARALALDGPDIAAKFKIKLNCGDDRLLVFARAFLANSR